MTPNTQPAHRTGFFGNWLAVDRSELNPLTLMNCLSTAPVIVESRRVLQANALETIARVTDDGRNYAIFLSYPPPRVMTATDLKELAALSGLEIGEIEPNDMKIIVCWKAAVYLTDPRQANPGERCLPPAPDTSSITLPETAFRFMRILNPPNSLGEPREVLERKAH